MKKLRALLSLIICVIMIFSLAAPALTANAAKVCNCDYTPIIYIKGRTNIYKTTDDTSDENMAETNFSMGSDSVIEATVNIVSVFAKALITDDWDDYCDVVYEELIPIYEGYKLSDEGEIDNQSGINPYWNVDNRIDQIRKNPDQHKTRQSDVENLQFQYDMRLDPCVNAGYLNQYIEAVREATGHNKVHIIGRCEGTVIANAYFQMYGYDAVDKVIIYNSIANGAEIADDLFSNKIMFDADAMNIFVNTFLDTSPVLDFVKATVNLAAYNGLLEMGTDFVEEIIDKVSTNLISRLIRDIFGTCPGWWGMVSPDVFEQAKDFIFGDNADGRYDKLFAKLDNYNYNYKVNARSILEEMDANGVDVHIFAKYGSQMYPAIESYDILGDGVVSLYKQTLCGATDAGFKKTLSEEYIAEREALGFGEYISADKMVDASTAPLCEKTWYFKELEHHVYPRVVNNFILQIFRCNYEVDIHTFEDRPQFMYYQHSSDEYTKDVGVLYPLTEETKDLTEDTTDTSSVFAVLLKWLTAFFNFITSLLNKQ